MALLAQSCSLADIAERADARRGFGLPHFMWVLEFSPA